MAARSQTDGSRHVVDACRAHRDAVGGLVVGDLEAHPAPLREAVQLKRHLGIDVPDAQVIRVGEGA